MINLAVVVTTIQEPTNSMLRLREVLDYYRATLFVVGDEKGPSKSVGDQFFSADDTDSMKYKITELGLPRNSYVRKMAGYLAAMEDGAMCIYETDDDNAPLENWSPRLPFATVQQVTGDKWANPYMLYTEDYIWPRGFPPGLLKSGDDMIATLADPHPVGKYAPIQQGLANGAPDVDALWRLTIGDEPFTFKGTGSYEIMPGSFAPFNSQSTWWWPEVFTFMYLPVTVPWRATDIWRSLVAQRILWERNRGVVFHGPEVYQDRNEHDLLKDFKDEQLVYLKVAEAAEVLRNTELTNYVSHRSNIVDCYRALEEAGLVNEWELTFLHAWLQDVKTIMDRREEV